MKKKLFLLPITLTAFAPTISLVGCGGDTPEPPEPEVHKVKVDPSSDTSDITISASEITLNQELVIPYEIINQEKELDVDSSWLKFDSSSYPLNTFSYSDNKVTIPTSYVTTYDITICLKSRTPEPDISIDLLNDSSESTGVATTESSPFTIELNKTYRLNVDASICPVSSFMLANNIMSFLTYIEGSKPKQLVGFSISRVKVGDNVFQSVESESELQAGKYTFYEERLIFNDYSLPDQTFTMSIDLTFIDNEGQSVVARWLAQT